MTFFSKLGENIILPQDVLIQSKETAGVSGAINATIGIATKNKKALFLPSIDKVIKDINNSEYLPYSPTPGLPEMRNLWKEKIISDNPKINIFYSDYIEMGVHYLKRNEHSSEKLPVCMLIYDKEYPDDDDISKLLAVIVTNEFNGVNNDIYQVERGV